MFILGEKKSHIFIMTYIIYIVISFFFFKFKNF